MARKTLNGPEHRLDLLAHQAATLATGLGVAVEEGGSLRFLNEPARTLLLVPESTESRYPGSPIITGIPLEALPEWFQAPSEFQEWRESVLAKLPDRSAAGRFWTKAGRFVELKVFKAGDGSDGIFVWSIRDLTGRQTVEDQLQKASELVQNANEAKTHLLAMMSHEVRTPMNAILGMTELLLHTPLTREQWNLLDSARTAGESLIGTLDSVLDISKVESRTLSLDRRAFSLPDLVEGLAEEVAPSVAEGGIDLSCLVDAEIPRVLEGDPDRIRQVLSNLLGNAIKFTSKGSVGLSAELLGESAGVVWIGFSVEDTGPGIQADSLNRIFDPFYQTGLAPHGDQRGVGLGLSIVRSFVDLLGGRVDVDGSPGKGTRFDVKLPLSRSESQFPKRRASDHHYPEIRTILLSPSQSVRSGGAQVFSSLQVTFALSRNPGELTELLREEPFDPKTIVFVDQRYGAPELDWIHHHLSLRSQDLDLSMVVLGQPGSSNGRNGNSHGKGSGNGDGSLKTSFLQKPLTRRGVAGVIQEVKGDLVTPCPDDPETQLDTSDLRGLRVLLVEDREENRLYLGQVLQGAGLLVDMASDGEIGLAQFKAGTYDLVLTDLDMPGLDGFQLLEGIRVAEKEEVGERVPVVAITAHTDPGIAERCFRAGMDAFVTKPVSRDELLSIVKDLAKETPLVVVVEDEPRSLDVTCQILTRRGFRAEGIGTGEEAVRRVERGGVAAMLLDMTLPDISGLEVVTRIRSLAEGTHLPVVGVTGHVGADQEEKFRAAGCTEFVAKPVQWDALLETLDRLLSARGEPVFTHLLDGIARLDSPESPQAEGKAKEKPGSGAAA